MATFIHTKLNLKSWHETHQVRMHPFRAIPAKGIATCHPGAEETELCELVTVVPGHLQLFQQQQQQKRRVAGSCIGQISLFLSLSFPRCKTGMLPLTFHTRMFGRLNSLAKGSEALAVMVLRKSRKLLHTAPRGRA